MNSAKKRQQLLNELNKHCNQPNAPSHVRVSYAFLQELHSQFAHTSPNLISKQRTELVKASKSIAKLRRNLNLIHNRVSSMKEANNKLLDTIKQEYNLLKGNYVWCFLELTRSFGYMREQLEKIATLAENSASEFGKRGKGHSRTVAVLRPIKRFAENALKRVDKSDAELRCTEVANGFQLRVLTKDKAELNPSELKQVEEILKNPVLSKRVSQYFARPPKSSAQTPRNDQPPSSPSSCSVTELEDFVYNVINKNKEADGEGKDFSKDVSLRDLLAVKREDSKNTSSPIATTEGCLKDLELMSREAEKNFDPKKVKKIEFSDNKIAEHIKKSKAVSNGSIDKLVLDSSLRNQSKDNILKHKEYVMLCRRDAVKVDSKEVSANSLMSSFDLPNETKESYISIASIKGNEKKSCESRGKQKARKLDESNSSKECNYSNFKKHINEVRNYSNAKSSSQKKLKLRKGEAFSKAKEVSEAYSAYYDNIADHNENAYKQSKYLSNKALKRSASNNYMPGNANLESSGGKVKTEKVIERNSSLRLLRKKHDSIIKLPSLVDSKKLNAKKLKHIMQGESKIVFK